MNASPTGAVNGSRLLVIDDDDDLRETLCQVLQARGHQVQGYASCDQALSDLRGGLPTDLILLDLMMPGMTGWEFRHEQRTDPALASIPLLVLTARATLERPGMPTLDEVPVLRKPFDLRSLMAAVERALGA